MDRDRVQGIWKQLLGAAKEHWGALTGDPFAIDAGSRERAAGRKQEQRSLARRASDRQLQDFVSRHRNWRDLSGD